MSLKSSPVYIHFRVQWHVLGPDSPGQRFEREKAQEFFSKLNTGPAVGGYDDFSYRPDRFELAKTRGSDPRGGERFGKVLYANDVLSLVEEYTEDSAQDFSQRLKVILDAWFAVFPETIVVIQRCCIRALATSSSQQDSRDFLGERVLKLQPSLDSKLGGKPLKVGFHLACQGQKSSSPMTLEAKVSSWRDSRSVWMEITSMAPLQQPLTAASPDLAEVLFANTNEFLLDNIIPLLAEYDTKEDEPRGEA